MKNTLITILVVAVVGLGAYMLFQTPSDKVPVTQDSSVNTTQADGNTQTDASVVKKENKEKTVIGKSVGGRDIVAYHFGTGNSEILFVGGIHGGYEWNTSLVAYEAMDYFKANLSIIPANVKITVIPVLNPDGLYKVVGTTEKFSASQVSPSQTIQTAGRFNANNVDLNRNFDCDWKSTAKWQSRTVSGGSSMFSEPESLAIKSYVEVNKPTAVITWYSAAGGVYSSSCETGISSETKTITKKYADASGYPSYESFDSYETTGDMVNWFAKNSIPAISVLLTNHEDTEWTKNKAGIDSLLKYYAK
ncbi:MAG: hypothetical protein EXS46_00245 [Candidatus Taylorbacteria bacterium]|nr:hypothetical protein [Candidatus Taylorbacteria bacterium]